MRNPGSCHTRNVISPPRGPPKIAPRVIASCVEDGPGNACAKAKSSMKRASDMRGTSSAEELSSPATKREWKSETWACGPPKATKASGQNERMNLRKVGLVTEGALEESDDNSGVLSPEIAGK